MNGFRAFILKKMKNRKIYIIVVIALIISFVAYFIIKKYTKASAKTTTQAAKTTNETVNYGGGGGSGSDTGGGDDDDENEVTLTAPSNLNIGLSKTYGLAYQADYFALAAEMEGGINNFWFYGKSNGTAYPTAEFATSENGYATIDLPSHSVTLNGSYYPKIGKIRYKIKDAQGNVVMYCHDTKGGYHGNLAANKRGNNHPNHSQRYLPYGTYTIEFENLSESNTPLNFVFGRAGGNLTEFFQVSVASGTTEIRTLVLFDSPNAFKLNCNLV